MNKTGLPFAANRSHSAPSRSKLAVSADDANSAPGFLNGLPGWDQPYEPKQGATKALKALIESAGYTLAFQTAIQGVASQNIPELSRIQTIDQFYFYVDALVTWIPETRHWSFEGNSVHERTVYLRIVQFYYYFNHPQLVALQSPIAPSAGEDLTALSSWLRTFAVDWGSFLDTSASAAQLASFKYAPEYNWQDYQHAPEDYETFNAFFARQFTDIETQRPVAAKDDDRTVVFPAESTFVGQWTISTGVGDPLPAPPSIVVKHIEWPIHELLSESAYAADFAGGRFCHSFLNTYDYHRLHTPVAGKVLEARFVPGQVYLEVELKEQGDVLPNGDLANAVIPKRYLDADDPTGYQFVQCRGLLVLETEHFGKVAVLPMGMAQVSSVVFTGPGPEHTPIQLSAAESDGKSYDEQVTALNEKIEKELVGKRLEKGEMFSFFQFGGSDCVVVFERQAVINITAQVGVHYPIRSQYAVSNYNAD